MQIEWPPAASSGAWGRGGEGGPWEHRRCKQDDRKHPRTAVRRARRSRGHDVRFVLRGGVVRFLGRAVGIWRMGLRDAFQNSRKKPQPWFILGLLKLPSSCLGRDEIAKDVCSQLLLVSGLGVYTWTSMCAVGFCSSPVMIATVVPTVQLRKLRPKATCSGWCSWEMVEPS